MSEATMPYEIRTAVPNLVVLGSAIPDTVEVVELEKSYLGSLLVEPGYINETPLKADDFHLIRHRHIFEAMTHLGATVPLVEIDLIIDRLESLGLFADIGGSMYLVELMDAQRFSANAPHFAERIRDASVRRQYLAALDAARAAVMDRSIPIEDTSARIESVIGAVSAEAMRGGLEHVGAIIEKDTARLTAILDGELQPVFGVPMPLLSLESRLHGWRNGKLAYIASYSHMGKTTLLMQAAIESARAGEETAIFSVEGTTEEVTRDIVAMIAGIKADDVATGNVSEQQYKRWMAAASEVSKLPLFIDGDKALDPRTMYRRVDSLMQFAGRRVVTFVDYLGKLQLPPDKQMLERDRRLKTSYLSDAMKATAVKLQTPMIVAVQTNRPEKKTGKNAEESAARRPTMSDMADSADLERDADLVIMPWRASRVERDAELIIDKNKINGWNGIIPCWFDIAQRRFTDLELPRPTHSQIQHWSEDSHE
jgi:replicative DNA helicase